MQNLMAWGDYLCNLCINIMEEMANMSGITYGTLNILFFVILGPLATLIFMFSSLIQLKNGNSNRYRTLNIVLFILGTMLILAILVPVIYVFFFGKF